jgi:putative transposase
MNAQVEKVVDIVADRRCVRLDDLIAEIGDADAVFFAIAQQQVYFDLHGQLLCRPQVAYVCCDEAYAKGITLAQTSAVPVELNTVSLAVGAAVNWDGAIHKIIGIGEGHYTLQHEKGQIIRLRDEDVSTLVRDGVIRSIPRGDNEEEALRRIMRASVESMNEAIRREKLIQAYDEGRLPADVKARTVRVWKRAWKKAEELFGHGFLGLLNRFADRGDDAPKITPEQLRVLELSIDEDFLNVRKTTRKKAHILYQERCKTEGGPSVSYTTYCEHIRSRKAEELEYWRSGRRAAYQLKGPANDGSKGITDLYPTHGDRAWEVAHIDHTELDIELVSALTGKPLGRPHLTMMIDAYTRIVLAFVLSFEKPSSRTLMLVMRECVRRHGRLPSKLVVDHGSEFMGTYFEVLAARQVITKIERGVGESRGGAPMERAFGRNDTQFIHDLLGNTQARKMGRSRSATHDPSVHAVWTPDAFEEVLAEFLHEIQPNTVHLGILERPADRLARSLTESGNRNHTHIPYDRVFYVGTLLTPDRQTRTVKGGTVRFNHVDYTAPEMARVKSKTKLRIKYDPYDIAHIYAFIENEWIRLTSTHHLIREFTERQIRLAHLEVMALALHAGRDYSKVSELMLKFLADIRARERSLLAQRRQRQQQEDAGIRDNQARTPSPRKRVRTHSIKSRKVATPE